MAAQSDDTSRGFLAEMWGVGVWAVVFAGGVVACGSLNQPPPAAHDAPAASDAHTVDAAPCPDSQKIRLYPDADGDGFGDATSAGQLLCGATIGYVVDHTDCADHDPNAHPFQTAFFAVAISGATSTGLLFDYNCDGAEVPQSTATTATNCQSLGTSCHLGIPGWYGSVPACGVTGDWNEPCQYNVAAQYCAPIGGIQLKQACR